MRINNEDVKVDRYSHAENIKERMDFLFFIMGNATSMEKISISYISKLWTMLHESPASLSDSQSLFKFLREIAADQTTVNYTNKNNK